jgi:myo-inositol-1(or 4)-monophosphatase
MSDATSGIDAPGASGIAGAAATGSGLTREAEVAARLALAAGKLALAMRDTGDLQIGSKGLGEVVTSADRAADLLVHEGLAADFPDDTVYSEETPDSAYRLSRQRVWIVDPLDGTSTFVSGGDEFCVSIGLSVGGQPVAGAVYNPCRDELMAGAIGHGVTLNGVPAKVSTVAGLSNARLSTSRRDVSRSLLPELGARSLTVVASMAYKLARVSAGLDDGTVSGVPRKEWGTCAGVALVLAAGGKASLLDGTAIRYNRAELRQPTGMLASGPALYDELLAALEAVPLTRTENQ